MPNFGKARKHDAQWHVYVIQTDGQIVWEATSDDQNDAEGLAHNLSSGDQLAEFYPGQIASASVYENVRQPGKVEQLVFRSSWKQGSQIGRNTNPVGGTLLPPRSRPSPPRLP